MLRLGHGFPTWGTCTPGAFCLPQGVHLLYSRIILRLGHNNELYLYGSKNLKVTIKI